MIDNLLTRGFVILPLIGVIGCAANQLPREQLARTQASAQTAEQLGARQQPNAALHLKFANDQIARAKKLMDDGEEKEARRMLSRAEADAEMALALTKSTQTRNNARQAAMKARELRGGTTR